MADKVDNQHRCSRPPSAIGLFKDGAIGYEGARRTPSVDPATSA
jgi:hypothetical protein